MARRNTVPAKNTLRLDFTNASQPRFLPPEEEFAVEIAGVEKTTSQSGNDQLAIDFRVLTGKHSGKQFRNWFSLVDQALWKLSGILNSAGFEVPDGPLDLDLDELQGRRLLVNIEHREYQGDTKAEIRDSSPLEDADEDADEEEEEKKRPSKTTRGSKKKPLPKLTADETAAMDEDELGEVIEKYDLGVDLDQYKTLRKKAAAVTDALENAGHLDE